MLIKTYSLRPHCVSCWTTYIQDIILFIYFPNSDIVFMLDHRYLRCTPAVTLWCFASTHTSYLPYYFQFKKFPNLRRTPKRFLGKIVIEYISLPADVLRAFRRIRNDTSNLWRALMFSSENFEKKCCFINSKQNNKFHKIIKVETLRHFYIFLMNVHWFPCWSTNTTF